MADSKHLNEMTLPYTIDVYGFLPIGSLTEYAKIRPVQQSGVTKMKKMIIAAGYQNSSVLKVRAPTAQKKHVSWGLEDKLTQLKDEDQWEPPWEKGSIPMKHLDERKDDDDPALYGIIDGAHRFLALMELVEDPKHPKYTLDFLVPCQVFKSDVPDPLVLAIAARENAV